VVKDAFRRAYQSCRNEAITDSLLGTFEMSIDEFKKKGSKQLHPKSSPTFRFGCEFQFGCTFMVYGFDDNVKPTYSQLPILVALNHSTSRVLAIGLEHVRL